VLWAVRAHTYTHTLTRRGCTYIALLCNDGNFFSLTHTPTPCISLSSLLSLHQEWQFLGYEAHRSVSPSFTNSEVTALAFLSHPKKRRNGRSERKQKALFGPATDGGEFGRSECVEMAGNGGSRQGARTWRWLLTCARVRSFTSMSSSTDLGVAPAGGRHEVRF
jgi:hypothetical protein